MATNKNFDIDDMSAFDDVNIDAMDADIPKGKISKSRKIVSTLFKDTAIGTSRGIRRALKNEFTETSSQLDDLSRAYDDAKNAAERSETETGTNICLSSGHIQKPENSHRN